MLKRTVTAEKILDVSAMYTFNEKNRKGETIVVDIYKRYYDNKNKKNQPHLWKKHGFTDKLFNSILWVDVYVTDKNGQCWGKYNPFEKLSDDGKRRVVNFDNLLEVSEENIMKALEMVEELAFT